jgi:TM2 domain-containing membrane protein YozV
MSRRGSAGNILAAVASFFLPGLGQLFQGRFMAAVVQFGAYMVVAFLGFGWLVRIISAVEAGLWDEE